MCRLIDSHDTVMDKPVNQREWISYRGQRPNELGDLAGAAVAQVSVLR